MPAIDDEIVPLRLAQDRFRDRGMQEIVSFRCAQRCAQVGRVFLAKAHVKRSGAGDADAIAGFAEIVGEGSDEAQPASGLCHPDVAGGAARAIIDIFQREVLGKPRAHDRERQVLLEPSRSDIP